LFESLNKNNFDDIYYFFVQQTDSLNPQNFSECFDYFNFDLKNGANDEDGNSNCGKKNEQNGQNCYNCQNFERKFPIEFETTFYKTILPFWSYFYHSFRTQQVTELDQVRLDDGEDDCDGIGHQNDWGDNDEKNDEF